MQPLVWGSTIVLAWLSTCSCTCINVILAIFCCILLQSSWEFLLFKLHSDSSKSWDMFSPGSSAMVGRLGPMRFQYHLSGDSEQPSSISSISVSSEVLMISMEITSFDKLSPVDFSGSGISWGPLKSSWSVHTKESGAHSGWIFTEDSSVQDIPASKNGLTVRKLIIFNYHAHVLRLTTTSVSHFDMFVKSFWGAPRKVWIQTSCFRVSPWFDVVDKEGRMPIDGEIISGPEIFKDFRWIFWLLQNRKHRTILTYFCIKILHPTGQNLHRCIEVLKTFAPRVSRILMLVDARCQNIHHLFNIYTFQLHISQFSQRFCSFPGV